MPSSPATATPVRAAGCRISAPCIIGGPAATPLLGSSPFVRLAMWLSISCGVIDAGCRHRWLLCGGSSILRFHCSCSSQSKPQLPRAGRSRLEYGTCPRSPSATLGSLTEAGGRFRLIRPTRGGHTGLRSMSSSAGIGRVSARDSRKPLYRVPKSPRSPGTRVFNDQCATGRDPEARGRGGRQRATGAGARGRHRQGEGREAARRPGRELAGTAAGARTAACAGRFEPPELSETVPSSACCSGARFAVANWSHSRSTIFSSGSVAGAAGCEGEGESGPHGSRAGLGQGTARRVAGCGRHRVRRHVPAGQQSGRGRRQRLTENSIWWIVREYAGNRHLGKIAPHDLRSYAVCRTMPNFVRRHAPTSVGVVMDSA